MPNKKTLRSDNWLSTVLVGGKRRRFKEDDSSHSRAEDMPMASAAGKARVDVPATNSDRRRALMVKRSEDWYSDDNETFRSDDCLSVSVDLETEDEISRWKAVSQVDLEKMEEGFDDFIFQERSLPELNPTFPVGSKHALHSQSSGEVMHEKVKNIPIVLPSVMHEKVKNSPTDLPDPPRGVRLRPGVKGFFVEIRPKKWKKTVWLGTYKTAHEAARAYDAGIFYTGKEIPLNFHNSVTSFVAVPPVSPEDFCPSSVKKFEVFMKKQAAKAARRALDDPEWKRTYEERYLQVMWLSVCRIFWL